MIGFALPYFWVGLLLVFIFSVTLGWLPYEDAYNILTDTPGWNLTFIGDVLEPRDPPRHDDPHHADRLAGSCP